MITYYRAGTCIFALRATLEKAEQDSGADLSGVINNVDALLTNFLNNPAAISEQDIIVTARMIHSFLVQNFFNIRWCFEELDPNSTAPVGTAYADGTYTADGSATAS